MKTFTLERPHGFALTAASEFYAGFVPGSGMAAARTETLTFTFLLDRTFEAVAVELHEERSTLVARYEGTDDEAGVTKQIQRMLGLDVDARAWLELAGRDPVAARLQSEFPGFFTAAKPSPYDAAAWGVISPRMPISNAAKIKRRIAEAYGERVTLAGHDHRVFPGPRKVLRIREVEGLSAEKIDRLHGVARAALDGRLDAERLRSMREEDALKDLQKIRGIGPWTAGHVLYRGAAIVDALPTAEPRVLHGYADVAGLDVPTPEAFTRIAEAWRPFRMWMSILCARHLARTSGWNAPSLGRERRALSQAARA